MIGLYLSENLPGTHEFKWQTSLYLIAGVFVVILIAMLLALNTSGLPQFMMFLTVLLSISLLFISYIPAVGIFLITGVTGFLVSLTASTPLFMFAGLPLFICLYLFSVLFRISFELTDELDKTTLKETTGYTLIFAGFCSMPFLMLNILRNSTGFSPEIIFAFLNKKTISADRISRQPGPGIFTTLGGIFLVIIITLLLVLVLRRFFSQKEEPDKSTIPKEAFTKLNRQEKTSDSADYLQTVMRGGTAGEILSIVHKFLLKAREKGFSRKTGETVTSFYKRLASKFDLDINFKIAGKIYNEARYGFTKIDQKLLPEIKKQTAILEKGLKNNEPE